MTKQEFINEMMEYEGFDSVAFVFTDGTRSEIGDSGNYLGGEEGEGFISELLGNVCYDSYESCVYDTANYIYDELEEEIEEFEI